MTPPFFRQVHESFVTGTEAGAFFAHACSDVQKQFLLAAATAADGFGWPMQCRHIIDGMNAEERRHVASFLDTLKEHIDEPVDA